MDSLAQEVRILREAIDELRELLEWAMQNRDKTANDHPSRPVATAPRDGVDEESGEEINRRKPDRKMDEAEEAPSTAAPGELF